MVTAVIVAHDGAVWLPRLLEALTEQTVPLQRAVAVDTGSRDRSGSVLAAGLGQGAVFGMDRSTGYAAAVRRALQHKAASGPVGGSGSTPGRVRADQTEWLWLLHDDCEPAPDALEQLLRGAAETPTAAVFGPKLRDWTNRDVIIEAGVTIDTAGRRITGVEPREVDQGQHDGDRDVHAVCSAGMLVRRDVWEQTGGFDPGMTLFDEDIDFCWRVHGAGHRVRVITDAVVFHAAAATRRRRAISVGRRARLLDRRNGLLTLLGNLPPGPMAAALIGNMTLSLLRTVFYLVAKRPGAALDESAAVLGVVGHPLRLARARQRRARGRRAAYSSLRADLPAGHSIRRAAEFAASMLSRSPQGDLAGAHHATDDPDEDESLLTDSGLLQRLLTRPGVLLMLGLIAITIAAERSVITAGTLGGGALLPAWEGASSLWAQFLQAYHPVGIGSASVGPPYVGLVALLATVLLGKAWLAIDVLLLGCVPLAGITSFLALRRVTLSVPVRLWAAASYALLPVASGAISAGRLGSAVAFVLIPAIGMLAGRMLTQEGKAARRAAWATGLTVMVGAAFVPLLWPMAVVGAVLAGLTLRRSAGLALWQNLAIVVLTPPLLLLPWLIQQLQHPSLLLLEAGVQQPGLAAADLPARSLLLLSPGGPGLPPYWTSAALVIAGLAALLAGGRRKLIVSGWIVALLGFAAALLASRVTVTPAGGQPLTAWPGPGLAVAAAGLLLAAAAAADAVLRPGAARGRAGSSGRGRGRRPGQAEAGRAGTPARLTVAVVGLVACTAPVLAAGYWLLNGVSAPLRPASGEVVPSLVSATAGTGLQSRTLVLTPSRDGAVSYLLLRGASPLFGDPALTPVPAAQAALTTAVAGLVAPGGGEAGDQSAQLARFDIGFVLMRAPIDAGLAEVLDGVDGLNEVSTTSSFDLWRLTSLPSRVSVVEPSGAVVAIPSGTVGVSGAHVPAAGGTLLLSEPAGGWSAAVNGHALTPVASPAGSWAQAFRLPAGGGTLTISRSALWHYLLMAIELIAFVVVAGLALPGIKSAAELEASAEATAEADELGGSSELDDSDAGSDSADRELVVAGRRSRAEPAARAEAGARMARSAQAGTEVMTAGLSDLSTEQSGSRSAGRASGHGGRRGGRLQLPARRAGKSAGAGRRAAAQGGAAMAAGAAAGAASTGLPGPRPGAAGPGAAGRAATGAAEDARFTAGGPGPDGRRDGTSQPGRGASRPGAAWPAGQPVSRFVSGPPDAALGPDPRDSDGPRDLPYRRDDRLAPGRSADEPEFDPRSGAGTRYGEPPRRSIPSPSGTPFDERRDSVPGRSSGTSYRDPGYAQEPGRRGGDYGGQSGYEDGGYERPRYPAEPEYGRRGRYPDEAGSPGQGGNEGRRGYPGGDGAAADGWQADGSAASWRPDAGASGWPAGGEADWAQDQQQSAGWPEGEQQGWPQDYRGWPDHGESLEALPEAEVHHDWSGRDGRDSRGWPAPEQDNEGDDW